MKSYLTKAEKQAHVATYLHESMVKEWTPVHSTADLEDRAPIHPSGEVKMCRVASPT